MRGALCCKGGTIKQLAIKTRKYLEENCKSVDLHMVRRFPFNSCETTSLLLGKIIKSLYPSKNVYFVDGECKSGGGRHFWLEIDNLCFDLTADQFETVKAPFYGVCIEDHAVYFLKNSVTDIDVQFLENDFFTSKFEQFHSTIRDIIKCQ